MVLFYCLFWQEILFDINDFNDYLNFVVEFIVISFGYMDCIKKEFDMKRKFGIICCLQGEYFGKYWNEIKNFCIKIIEMDGKLEMCFQGREFGVFEFVYYENDMFIWWMLYDEIVWWGWYIGDYVVLYYLIKFLSLVGGGIDILGWVWNFNLLDEIVIFLVEGK